MGVRARINALVEWAKNSRVGRTIAWFNACNGGQLCAGIAYLSLFSLFAILTVGWSAFSASLGNYPGMKEAVLAQINSWIPNLIGEIESGFLVTPDQLIVSNALNWASMVAIFLGTYWVFRVMTALRTAVCRICAVSRRAGNVLWDQSSKFLGFIIMAVGIILSAVTTIATEHFGALLALTLGARVSDTVNFFMGLLSTILGALVNAAVMIGVIRLIARVWFASARKRHELWIASLVGGLVLALLRTLGTSLLVRSALGNPLLAPFVAIVTILMLADFTVRVLLLICAWVYDPPRLDSPRPLFLIKPRHPPAVPQHNATEVTTPGSAVSPGTQWN